ncbi:MAG: UDP-N-acetylglucosamine 2-epimerase (non-hydrolyzing), partial [Acidobacteria bacterium]|nr:UDP-N-acetylglucosamine 2-epimerase (non-hydrolyzing) [Acidobacteriota bacterium]
MKCRIIAVLGTRPEAIKLAVVIDQFRRRSQEFEIAVIHTGQHRTMLDHALQLFQIKPDFDLDVMRPNQTLSSLTARVLDTVENACLRFRPDMVLVQGDTTTAFASALAAYYSKAPVAHVEAGLRSRDIYNPFPEEVNRRLVSAMSEIHFAPTASARDNLLAEGVPSDRIVVTGNTVVDTLRALGELSHSWENT